MKHDLIPISVNDILTDPLAGCQAVIKDPGSFLTLRDSLYLRLVLMHGTAVAGKVLDDIDLESDGMLPDSKEYVINELQYEVRATNLHPDHFRMKEESELLDRWAAVMMDQFPLDDVLAFISLLKQNRISRRNLFF